jgi:hypothetical protein
VDLHHRWRVIGVAVDGDLVYAVSLDNLLRAVNRSNGNQRWKRALATRPAAAPVSFIGLVAQPGYRPALSTFTSLTGEPIGTYEQTSELRGPLLIDPWPRARRVGVVAITDDGQVLALRSADLMLREAAPAALTALPGRAVAREALSTEPLRARSRRDTPSASRRTGGAENESRIVSCPLPSTKKRAADDENHAVVERRVSRSSSRSPSAAWPRRRSRPWAYPTAAGRRAGRAAPVQAHRASRGKSARNAGASRCTTPRRTAS